MTGSAELRKILRESGIKRKFIMEALGIKAYSTFRGKMADPSRFTGYEIRRLMDLLGLTQETTNRIFFTNNVA